jgi:hypothetical protein
MSKKHLKQKIRDRAAQRDDAIDALLVAERRIRQLEWLITEWADAKQTAYHDEPDVLRAEDALLQAVGR